MRLKLVIPAVAALAATLAAPAFAQSERVYGPGYRGPAIYSPAYRFHRAYNRAPMDEPFYNDGWVPESIYDHSRTGGIDPNVNPPS